MSSSCSEGVILHGEQEGNAAAGLRGVEGERKERVTALGQGPLGQSWVEGWLLRQWSGVAE